MAKLNHHPFLLLPLFVSYLASNWHQKCSSAHMTKDHSTVTAMKHDTSQQRATKRLTPVGIIFAALGLLLFVYFIWKANPMQIWGNIKQLGAGFLLVLMISSVRPVVRAFAWTRCFEGEHQLRFRDAYGAYLIGDAVGTLVPLGILASEPAKAALVRRHVPLLKGVSALAIENLFYSLSVILFIFSGTVALMLSFSLKRPLQIISVCALVTVVLLIALAYLVIREQWKLLSGALDLFARLGIALGFVDKNRDRVRSVEERVYGFYAGNWARIVPIMFLEACYHLSGVAEVYTVLYFITDQPSLLTAFVLESVNRVINVTFKFVPLRLGVDEAGSGWITEVLRLGKASGVTLAIIRKARIMCWTAVGVVLLIRRGLSLRDITEGEGRVMDETNATPNA